MPSDPDTPSSNPQVSPSDLSQLLSAWNHTETAYPVSETVHHLFETQVARSPDAPALIFGDSELSYAELNRRANRLAHALIRLGAGPETVVGVCLERSFDLVVALLAVLKAGAAYVPIDPDYPPERLALMAAASQAALLITHRGFQSRLAGYIGPLLDLDEAAAEIAAEDGADPTVPLSPENLAYVIFTSGSTGEPKGAMIPHRALTNHMCWMQRVFPLAPADRVFQKTPISFDASIWEFYAPLLAGATLVIAEPGGHREPAYLARALLASGITILQATPSLLALLLEQPEFRQCTQLRRLFSGGEALTAALAERLHAVLPVELVNLYGPAEACVDTVTAVIPPAVERDLSRSSFDVARDLSRLEPLTSAPIGRPIDNVKAYILDNQLQPVPVGAPGEL